MVIKQYDIFHVSLDDQIRTVDKRRLVRKVGRVARTVFERIKQVIQEMLVN